MDKLSLIEYVKRWKVKVGFTILEQILFSGANFIQGILLARWLSAEQFGSYAVAFTALMFVYQIYSSFLLDSMSVLAPAHYSEILRGYFVTSLKLHFLITISTGIIFIFSAFLILAN